MSLAIPRRSSSRWRPAPSRRFEWRCFRSGAPGPRVRLIAQEFQQCLGPGTDVELLVDMFEVDPDGMVTDREAVGDLLADLALGKQLQDFLFPRGKERRFTLDRGWGLEGHHDFARNFAGRRGAALTDLGDGVQNFAGRGAFQKVAARPGLERAEDAGGVLIDREHDDLHLWDHLLEAGRTFDARSAGQIDVHQDDVGLVAWNLLQTLLRRGTGADATDAGGPAQHALEIAAHRSAVLNQGDRRHNIVPGSRGRG